MCDHLDCRTVCAHWMPQNLTDSNTLALANVFDFAMEESFFSSAFLQLMRCGLIIWHPKPKKHEGPGNTHVPPQQQNLLSIGEIMVTVFWNHTNVFLMDLLDICYPFAICTSESKQSSQRQDICYPTFWNCYSVCDRTDNFLIVCLVQLWNTCCYERFVLSHNLSEISNVLLQYWKLSKLYTATAE